MSIQRAVVLLSGGLDSATVLAIARRVEDYECHALSFRYGQRHEREIESAKTVARELGARQHLILDISLGKIGGSALTTDLDVPHHRALAEKVELGIPVTYVPARNTIFLSCALAWAEVLGAADIFIGVNAIDYSGYPDCRPEFIAAFEKMANLATRAGTEKGSRFRIHTPLSRMTKAEIIRRGLELSIDYTWTHSCYDPLPAGTACGTCDACLLRLKGFMEVGIPDPIEYAKRSGKS